MKPKLRFPGYEEEWEEKKLGDIGEFKKGKNLSKKDISENGKNLCVLYGELYTTYSEVINHVVSTTDVENEFIMGNKNDVLIPSSGESAAEIAIASVLDISNVILGGDINVFRSNESGKFIAYFLTKNTERLSKIAQGATVVHLYAKDLKQVKISFPSLPEQEKIGEFFSLLDQRIEKQEEKIELMKERKKGWMQKLFHQEIRFKDENGNDYPDWEEKKLGEILVEISDKTTINNQYMLLSSTNNGLYNQLEYFKNQVASKNNIGYKILKRNQLVLSPQNLWLGNINFNNKFDIGIVSPSYKIFDIKNENFYFINYLLHIDKAFYFYKNASEQGASIVRRNLNMNLFYDISFSIPSLPEQEKIANFLSVQDELIEKEEEKLNLLKEQKKGLLQQMFV